MDVFDKLKDKNPNLINPGDTVTFYQITKEEYFKFNEK